MKNLKFIFSLSLFSVLALSQNSETSSFVSGSPSDPLMKEYFSNNSLPNDNEIKVQKVKKDSSNAIKIVLPAENQGDGSKNNAIKTMSTETVTFTNASSTGREGPTQAQINSAYSGTNLANKVTVNTQGVQEWTVPATTVYTIDAYGAQGGNMDGVGGKGARMKGDFSLNKDDVIYILVGQKGLDSYDRNFSYSGKSSNDGGGGGGGTFVVKKSGSSISQATTSDILVVAGGGGGKTADYTNDANRGQSATTGGHTYNNGGGTNGSGGNHGLRDGPGAGGGGFLTDGTNSSNGTGTNGGKSFKNGGVGGTATGSSYDGGSGGFGGGGGGWHNVLVRSGGGGGYSGGQGGSWAGLKGGGGGGSKNNGSNQTNTAGSRSGHGQVIITYIPGPSMIITATNS